MSDNKGGKRTNIEFKEVVREFGKFSRKVNTLSKAVDFVIEEAMPTIFKDENIEKVYEQYKKQLDFFMRHIV